MKNDRLNLKKLARHVRRAQSGSKHALSELYEMTSPYVYYYALTMLCDEEKARDASQEIFVTVFEKLHSLRDPQAFLGWLKAITANYCTTRLKGDTISEVITDTLPDDDPQIDPESFVESQEIRDAVSSAVETLSPRQREVIMMYYYEELSVKEISDILDISEGTVKSRLHYARENLKTELERYQNLSGVPLMSCLSYSLIRKAKEIYSEQKPALLKATPPIERPSVGRIVSKTPVLVKAASVVLVSAVAAGGVGVYAAYRSTPDSAQHNAGVAAAATSDEGKSLTTVKNPINKTHLLSKMINSVDYYDTVSGVIERKMFMLGDYPEPPETISYMVDMKTGTAYQSVRADELYDAVIFEYYSCGGKLYEVDNRGDLIEGCQNEIDISRALSKEEERELDYERILSLFYIHDDENRSCPDGFIGDWQPSERVEYPRKSYRDEENGDGDVLPQYFLRQNPTNLDLAAALSIFPQLSLRRELVECYKANRVSRQKVLRDRGRGRGKVNELHRSDGALYDDRRRRDRHPARFRRV